MPQLKSPDANKRSVVIDGQKTSVSVEDEFWREIKRIVRQMGDDVTVNKYVSSVDKSRRPGDNLSASLRLAVLAHLNEEIQALNVMLQANAVQRAA